jgi:hypothetical protein
MNERQCCQQKQNEFLCYFQVISYFDLVNVSKIHKCLFTQIIHSNPVDGQRIIPSSHAIYKELFEGKWAP